jgi:hypothetical protein
MLAIEVTRDGVHQNGLVTLTLRSDVISPLSHRKVLHGRLVFGGHIRQRQGAIDLETLLDRMTAEELKFWADDALLRESCWRARYCASFSRKGVGNRTYRSLCPLPCVTRRWQVCRSTSVRRSGSSSALRIPVTRSTLGFQEHLPENVRLGEMSDWLAIPSIVKTAA